jgi:hypothetical protein
VGDAALRMTELTLRFGAIDKVEGWFDSTDMDLAFHAVLLAFHAQFLVRKLDHSHGFKMG